VFAQLLLSDSCIIFGKSHYGINGNIYGQEFTFTTPVIRKFTQYPDICTQNSFCNLYLTIPNLPYTGSTEMVVNLLSLYPDRQKSYEKYMKLAENEMTYKERKKLQNKIEGLQGKYIEMTLYYGKEETYKKYKRLEEKVVISSESPSIWYRKIGSQSSPFQLHSLLLSDLTPDTNYKLILNVNGKNITEISTSPFSKGSVFRTFPDSTNNLKGQNTEIMVASNLPSDHTTADKYYTQHVDA